MTERLCRRSARKGLTAGLLLAAACCVAQPEYWEPAVPGLKPVGSNPAANQMDERQFQEFTDAWRQKYQEAVQSYVPNYSDSTGMLAPPPEKRLKSPLPLARGGKAVAEIVVDLNPDLHTPEATLGRSDYPAEVAGYAKTGHVIIGHAAEELKRWLDTLTGADFPIVDRPGTAKTRIFVGANFARAHYAADLATLGAGEALDGFAIRAGDHAIFIFGATAKGTLNGVYAFLENNSDLIWAHGFSDIGTVYTVNPNLRAVWGDGLEIPGTIQRGWLGHYAEQKGEPSPFWMWQMRNRCNFIVAAGPSPKIAEWGGWREAGGHMLGTFLPEPAKPYFPWIPDPATGELKQPEKIGHYHHNICMTHPDLPEAYAKKTVEFFRAQRAKDPEAPLSAVRIGVEDPDASRNYGLCRCERCLRPIRLPDGREIPVQHAVKEGLTFRSAQFYLLLESIARGLAAEFPDARLSTYAYYFAAEPPPFQTRVQPWLCPYGGGGQLVHRDYLHPLFWETNAKWWGYAYGWSRITDLTVLRDYNGLLTNGRPFAEVLAWEVRALRELGIKRFGNETALNTAFLQMDFWVASRLYWNPDADVEALRKYYIRRTFREGAPEMERFFGEIRKWLYTESGIRREDFINLGWIIERMRKRDTLYRLLVRAQEQARHPMARANIARLRKTFAIWFHLDPEEATANAMLANANLGRHVRYSSFQHEGTPIPVSHLVLDGKPLESANLITAADAKSADFDGWSFSLRLRPLGDAARPDFQPPHLSLGNDRAFLPPDAAAAGQQDGESWGYWTPALPPEKQRDGSFLYRFRIEQAAGSPFVPAKFSRFRLSYPPEVWRQPADGTRIECALYDLQLTNPRGRRYAMPTLAEQQGNRARRLYFEGGEMGDK